MIVDFAPWIAGIATLVILVVGFFVTKKALGRREEIARDLIINYLKGKDFRRMSFERIRQNIDASYTDEFLAGLPRRFPNKLRRGRVRDPTGTLKDGLARIIPSETPSEAATEEERDAHISLASLERIRSLGSLSQVQEALDQIISRARVE